ncbi:DUF6628 family protein [Sphingomonas sp. HMP6]|uniref:DUF6628 family protein n=1 Tax=Sphingomonas sp. HMP6 TaxID=1517551 RepID=UPI0015965177|nr:DUF6628 family protein [Sphingomonas sp. HMP6]BCA57645.1 hypothetical protein HMP06_0414 [Sphingomonas sp. HMP6]
MTTTPAPSPAPSPAQHPSALAASLQGPLPADANARLALFAFRRMGAHGLNDAATSTMLMQAFGGSFRRPLVLMRAMMADLAHAAQCPITIAPCCCARMTGSETTVLTILARAETAPDSARILLGDLIGVRRPDGVLASMTLLAQSFADAGRPISL